MQDVARLLRGRIDIARINGSADRLVIQAYDHDRRRLFVEARWAPRPDIKDDFALQLLSREEAFLAANAGDLPPGRILTRELPHQMAGEMFNVGRVAWPVAFGPVTKPHFVAACKNAKAAKRDVQISAIHGNLSFVAPSPFEYSRQDLEWVLRKPWTTIRICEEGLLSVTVSGLVGTYAVYLRGVHTRHPPEPSDPLETMAQIAEEIDRANLAHPADDVGEDGNWHQT